MGRNRKTAKDNGTRFETAMESYLQWALDDMRIRRLRLHGAKDIGDIGNVYYLQEPVTIECKWTKTLNATPHLREACIEARNQDSPYPWVLQKKAGVGLKNIHHLGQQLAYTHADILDMMLADWQESQRRRILAGSALIGKRKDIVLITVKQFALLLNDGQPLGPDL